MMWLAWRQFRCHAMVAAGTLAVFATVLGLTGTQLAGLYDSSGAAACRGIGACRAAIHAFFGQLTGDSIYPVLYFLGSAGLLLAPALIGTFWGAPLVTRELEGDTLRLVWFQGVTRTRWALVKLALLGVASMAVAGLLSLMVSWWAQPIDSAGGLPVDQVRLSRLTPPIFDARGLAPLGYAAFGFVLGVTLGVFIRRTLPAMAATLLVFTVVQMVVPDCVRPRLVTPDHLVSSPLTVADLETMTLGGNGRLAVLADIPGAWIVSNVTVTPNGQVFTLPVVPQCQHGTRDECVAWLAGRHLRQAVTYLPAARYWELQWSETALFLTAATVLAGVCVLWIRHGPLP